MISYEKLSLHFEKHVNFTQEELEIVLACYVPLTIKKKEYLLEAGTVPKYDSFVVDGCLRQYMLDSEGKECTLFFAVQDWWVNDLHAFLYQEASPISIQALEDSELLVISRADKNMLYEKVPKMERLYRIILQKAFAALQRRMVENLTKTAEQRFIDYVEKYPEIASRLNNLQLASYLGISHEFLSKIKKRIINN